MTAHAGDEQIREEQITDGLLQSAGTNGDDGRVIAWSKDGGADPGEVARGAKPIVG